MKKKEIEQSTKFSINIKYSDNSKYDRKQIGDEIECCDDMRQSVRHILFTQMNISPYIRTALFH